ncbi:MAG: hypothetical protein ACTSVA_01605 [Candidatus Njordarchaeales archaeon]
MINPEIVIKVTIMIPFQDKKELISVHAATSIENRLAPLGIEISQTFSKNQLIFYLEATLGNKNPRLKLESIRRTLDDFLNSLVVSLEALLTLKDRGLKNE